LSVAGGAGTSNAQEATSKQEASTEVAAGEPSETVQNEVKASEMEHKCNEPEGTETEHTAKVIRKQQVMATLGIDMDVMMCHKSNSRYPKSSPLCNTQCAVNYSQS
jgi:hypothetical protein